MFVTLLSLAVCAAATPATQPVERPPLAYQAAGAPEAAGVRHLCLIYHGSKDRLDTTPELLLPYVAHVDAGGRPTDWFFDSFLFLEFGTDTGAWLHHYRPGHPQPTAADWAWLADCWFRPGRGLAGMEAAIENAGRTLKDSHHKVKIVICMPVPLVEDHGFGPLAGETSKLDFSREEDRRHALEWYIHRVMACWQKQQYKHLELVGFYWTAESILPADANVVRATSEMLHQRGQKLFWIPYFGSAGVHEWRSRGIDAVMFQPNYFFTNEPRYSRLTAAARVALLSGCGIEIEFDGRGLQNDEYCQRFWHYLNTGAAFGWMQTALLGYYEGGGALKAMASATAGPGREMYDALYRFVKGKYVPRGKGVGYIPMTLAEWDVAQDVALASRGAKVSGAAPDPKRPKLYLKRAIDGDSSYYTELEGYAFLMPGHSLTIELPAATEVGLLQMLLWDLDNRTYRYRVETSLDGDNWEPAVDRSAGEHRSWQVESFRPRQARHIRVTGLGASTGNEVRVVELEIYAPKTESPQTRPAN